MRYRDGSGAGRGDTSALGEGREPLVGVPQISFSEVPPDVSHSSSPARVVDVQASSSDALNSLLIYLFK